LGLILCCLVGYSVYSISEVRADPDLRRKTVAPQSLATGTQASFSVMAYNAYLKPEIIGSDDSRFRARNMLKAIRQTLGSVRLDNFWPDLMVISEGLDEEYAGERSLGPSRDDGYNDCVSNDNCLLKRDLWKVGYKWITENVGTEGFALQDGGIFVASRYPIVRVKKTIYENSACSDGYSDKGVIYAQIDRDGRPVHVFGTHLQASYFHSKSAALLNSCDEDDIFADINFEEIRHKQLTQLKRFIEAARIPKGETVILAGDLNIAYGSSEYFKMIQHLGAREFVRKSILPGQRLQTFDRLTNTMKRCTKPGRFGPANNDYYSSCGEFSHEPDAWYDYVLLIENSASRSKYSNTVVGIKTRKGRDLSDHHAVIGQVEPSMLSSQITSYGL